MDQIGSAVLVHTAGAAQPETLDAAPQDFVENASSFFPAGADRRGKELPLSVSDLLWLFVIGAFLGDMVERILATARVG